MLADALVRASSGQTSAHDALVEAARDTGVRMGRAAAEQRSRSGRRTALVRVLADNGYLPRQRGRDIVLANCPFHALVDRHPDLVCRMNLDLLTGVVDGLDCADTLSARLEPSEGKCCVCLGPR